MVVDSIVLSLLKRTGREDHADMELYSCTCVATDEHTGAGSSVVSDVLVARGDARLPASQSLGDRDRTC